MKNSLYVLDPAAMTDIINKYVGALVFTPNTIYFILTYGKVYKSSRIMWYNLAQITNLTKNVIDNKYDFRRFENMDNYIEQLDKITLENKGSVKINKSDIKSIKLPSGRLS